MTALIETAPKMDLAIHDMEHVVEELRASHAIDSPRLPRRAQREAAHTSLQGVLATVPRKSIEPMVLAVDGVAPKAVRARPSFRSAGRWSDERRLSQHGKEVETDLGADDGVLMVDGSAVPTQGGQAVGVKRPYGGELGKRANGQAGVFGGSVSPQGSTGRDRRWSGPTAWLTDDAYADRRRPCGRPPELPCKTKPALAQAMRAALVQTQSLRGRWVVADEACGGHPGFLEGVAEWGVWYGAEVPHTTRVWEERPATHIPPWRGRGRRPQRERLVAGAPEARTVREVAATRPTAAWTHQTIKEGRQGPLVAECAPRRVIAVRDAVPGPAVWLVRRRHVETGELKTSRCQAPGATAWEARVRMSGRRWPIATCCEDGKPRRGMGDDEGRRWTGWHPHRTLVILAPFLVVRLSLRCKKKRQR